MDISPETVGTLSLIMLAQAQEVIFLKATSGTKERNPQWSTYTLSSIQDQGVNRSFKFLNSSIWICEV